MRTRYEGWTRGPAIGLIVALLALIALACWSPSGSASPKTRATETEHSDLQLYRDIIAGVRGGGDYYEIAAEQQRSNGYPLKPFTTFRLPTHATIYAAMGEPAMIGIFWALAASLVMTWWWRLKDDLPFPLLGAFMVFLAGGIGGLLQPMTGLFHESWAGLLLALMIALRTKDRFLGAVLAGGAALMIRELALPMILAMAGLSLLERRWREASAWTLAIALFAGYLWFHARHVAAVVRPDDLVSPGWLGLLGPQFALKSIATVTFGIRLPNALAAALLVLSIFGWASIREGWALRVTLLLIGYGAMLSLFSRADTFYWALVPAPLAFAGLAFLPKAFRDLAYALRRVPQPGA